MSKALQRSLESKLAALDGPDWESSGDDDEEALTKKITKKKSKSKKSSEGESDKNTSHDNDAIEEEDETGPSSVIYLGHLPQGFEESQLLKFFSQFGKVTNVKLCRSKRTGNSKGYAFLKFADMEVASITAEAMSGYFMMGEKRLVCHVVPKEKIHEHLFSGTKERMLMSLKGETFQTLKKNQEKSRKEANSIKTTERMKKITQRLLKREQEKRVKLQSLGIDYDFPGYSASVEKKRSSDTVEKDVTAEKTEKKRKVSIDEDNDASNSETAPKSKKKAKKTPKKKRSDSDVSESSTKKSKKKESDASVESSTNKTPKKKRSNSDASESSVKKNKRKESDASESFSEKKTPKKKRSDSDVSESSTKKSKRKESDASESSTKKTPKKKRADSDASESSTKRSKKKKSEASLDTITEEPSTPAAKKEERKIMTEKKKSKKAKKSSKGRRQSL